MFYVCWMDFNGPEFIVYQWIFRFLSTEEWKVGTMYKSIVSLITKVIMQQHLVCNSCASSAAFPECLDRAQSGGKALRWFEGRVAGRMFRRIWPSFLPFFSPSSFLYAFYFSCSPSLPPFILTTIPPIPFSFKLYFYPTLHRNLFSQILFSLSRAGL